MGFARRFLFVLVVLAASILDGNRIAWPSKDASAAGSWFVASSGTDNLSCGAQAAPCRSITYVLSSVPGFAPGDTIHVGGAVQESVTVDKPVVIAGHTPDATIKTDGSSRVINVASGVSVTLSALTITNGGGVADGGGIYNEGTLIADRVVITANRATVSGGGVFNAGGGVLTMTHSQIAGNEVTSAAVGGGGVENKGSLSLSNTVIEWNKGGPYGGGIDNFGGEVTLFRVVIRQNEASSGAGIFNDRLVTAESSAIVENRGRDQGGGVQNEGALVLSNVTISDNTLLGGPGAGLDNFGVNAWAAFSFVSIVSNTIANTSSPEASGLRIGVGARVEMTGTVIAYNSAKNCFRQDGAGQSFNFNVSSDAQCDFLTQPGDRSDINPWLAPLRFNAGTYTHPPLRNSPLIDAVDATLLCPVQDQRGVSRPQGSLCDIGAHEVQASELDAPEADLAINTTAPPLVGPGSEYAITVRVNNNGPDSAQSPAVTITLPANAQFVSAAGANWLCGLPTASVTCDYQLPQLPVGMAPPIVITLIAPQENASLSATSFVSASSADPNPSNNTATVTSSIVITRSMVYAPVVIR